MLDVGSPELASTVRLHHIRHSPSDFTTFKGNGISISISHRAVLFFASLLRPTPPSRRPASHVRRPRPLARRWLMRPFALAG